MKWTEHFSTLPPCNYVRTLPLDWKMVPVTELTPEQIDEIEQSLAFDEALGFKFRDWGVNDQVDKIVLN